MKKEWFSRKSFSSNKKCDTKKKFVLKKCILPALCLLLALAFILAPLPASDLILRIYFDDITGDSCVLYYSADAEKSLSPDRCLTSPIDGGKKSVEFRLDGSLENRLTALRLDWPHLTEQLICVKSITLSSGGVIRKEYNPCYFFAEGNIASSHETTASLVWPRDRAYLLTGADDPYQLLSDELTKEIGSFYSHRTLSRICLCLFLAGCCFFARKRLFD